LRQAYDYWQDQPGNYLGFLFSASSLAPSSKPARARTANHWLTPGGHRRKQSRRVSQINKFIVVVEPFPALLSWAPMARWHGLAMLAAAGPADDSVFHYPKAQPKRRERK